MSELSLSSGGRKDTLSVGTIPRLDSNRTEGGSSFPVPKLSSAQSVQLGKALEQVAIFQTDTCWGHVKNNNLAGLKASDIDLGRNPAFQENILHDALLFATPDTNDCAKYLADTYPELIMQLYEDDEYRGESTIHMAIATRNVEMVEYLLERASDSATLINEHRATGHFFNQGWGVVKLGEHALTFAICTEQPGVVTTLVKYGAKLDVVDIFGNTILHYCVIHNLPDMFQHIVDLCEADPKMKKKYLDSNFMNTRNDAGFTAFQYATHLKKVEIFEFILEWKKMVGWKWGDVSFVAFPLNEIDTHGDNKNSVLETILADNALEFISSPVIHAVFRDKWDSYAKMYFSVWATLHVIYMIAVIAIFQYWPADSKDKQNTWAVYALIVPSLKAVITLYQTGREVHGLVAEHGRKRGMDIYFQWNSEDLSVVEVFHAIQMVANLSIVGIWIGYIFGSQDTILISMTICSIAEAIYTLFFAQAWPTTGRLVVTTLKILTGDIMRFFVVWLALLIGFSGGVGIIVGDSMSYREAFLTLYTLSMGVGEYWDDSAFADDPMRENMSRLLFLTFLMLSVVLLLNLLIAIMAETIEQIGDQMLEHYRFQWASTILLIERRVPQCMYTRTGVLGTMFGLATGADDYVIPFHLRASPDGDKSKEELLRPRKRPIQQNKLREAMMTSKTQLDFHQTIHDDYKMEADGEDAGTQLVAVNTVSSPPGPETIAEATTIQEMGTLPAQEDPNRKP